MKKYNIILMFILILLTISVSSYFFYLDIIYEDKIVKENVESLYELKKAAGRPVIEYASAKEVEQKTHDYNQIIVELNLDAIASDDKKVITIKGVIHNSYSYMILKRLLEIIKNDEVNVVSSCVGKNCTEDEYGFLIKMRPYLLKLK
ncbi:MAG: hypothetical protein JXQ66_01650 [Campylobacterales bacterium]|nr:hypothetical protein [Campylobacterales bacterium]